MPGRSRLLQSRGLDGDHRNAVARSSGLRSQGVGAWLMAGAVVSAIAALWAALQQRPAAPVSGGAIGIEASQVPLNPQNPSETAIGDFIHAGGLVLTSRQSDQVHGLSDIEVTGTNRLTAVSDFGVFLDAQLVFDQLDRLVNLADARITLLTGEDGKPLSGKTDADAEGLALLPGGDRLVSFEWRDRIWLYPAGGGPPRPMPMPAVSFPLNNGMEALAADPESGDDAYTVGGETGDTWTCRLNSASCIEGQSVDKPEEFGLVALKHLPGRQTAYLLRAFDEARGNRISLQVFRAGNLIARMDLAPPRTVDNYEGLAAVPRTDGSVRFYLISDDNARASQRTLLLAFDWRPR